MSCSALKSSFCLILLCSTLCVGVSGWDQELVKKENLLVEGTKQQEAPEQPEFDIETFRGPGSSEENKPFNTVVSNPETTVDPTATTTLQNPAEQTSETDPATDPTDTTFANPTEGTSETYPACHENQDLSLNNELDKPDVTGLQSELELCPFIQILEDILPNSKCVANLKFMCKMRQQNMLVLPLGPPPTFGFTRLGPNSMPAMLPPPFRHRGGRIARMRLWTQMRGRK